MLTVKDYNKIDSNFPKGSISYKGINVEYLIRNHLISQIRSKNNIGNKPIKLTFKTCIRLFFSFIQTSPNLFKKRKTWVLSNAERRKNYNGYYFDRVTSIVSETNGSVLYIENPIIVSHKFPTKDTILSEAIFFLLSFVVGALFYKKDELKCSINLDELEEEYDVEINLSSVLKRFVGQFKVMSFFLKWAYKPEKVYVAYPNGYPGYIKAFKNAHIPVIELQHGVIYSTHPSYNYLYNQISREFNPDYVFTYGLKDRDCLIELGYINEHESFVIGSYGLWYCKNRLKNENIYLESIIEEDSNKTILLTATNDDLHFLYEFGLELSKLKPDLKVLLLPRSANSTLHSYGNFFVLDVEEVNVFELYKLVDFHLTQNSTCALEALYIGLPSFILEKERKSIFSKNYSFIQSLNFIRDCEELIELITNNSYKIPFKDDVRQIFEDNVIQLFEAAENKIK